VDRALQRYVKDQRIAEFDITEKVTSRLLGWAKILGALLGILAVVAGYLGVKSVADLYKLTKKEIQASLESAKKGVEKQKQELNTEYTELHERYTQLNSNLPEYEKISQSATELKAKVDRISNSLAKQDLKIDNLQDQVNKIRPGVYRWPVKTGADMDAGLVGQQTTVQTTVKALTSLPLPGDSSDPKYQDRRINPVEFTIYSVEADAIKCKEEISGDYHLVLKDESGETMIVAAPNPDPAFVSSSSRWAKEIEVVHNKIKDKLDPTGTFKDTHLRVRVTGVGFFEFTHGATGEAKNGVQLHPLIDIEFL
jgi:uncharacterized membrane-anchored protein YhcB (DUF1043 family)